MKPVAPLFDAHYRVWNIIGLIGVLAVVLLLGTASVSQSGITLAFAKQPLQPYCAYKAAGASCPTCGLTRSCAALMQGQVNRSLSFHPLGVLIVAFLAIQLTLRSIVLFRGHRFWKWDAILSTLAFLACFVPFLFVTQSG